MNFIHDVTTCSFLNCDVNYTFDQKSGQDRDFANYFKVTMFALVFSNGTQIQVCITEKFRVVSNVSLSPLERSIYI